MSIDQQFNVINEKLQHLLKEMNHLKKENEKLRKELQRRNEKESATQHRIEELEQQTSILKLASGDMSDKDKKDFEKQINRYIREIDKCISFLSQ